MIQDFRSTASAGDLDNGNGDSVKIRGLVILCMLTAGLASCSSGKPAIMPSVTGEKLDVALSDIDYAGFSSDVDVVGGGTFGIVDKSNWVVCHQDPPAGTKTTKTPRLKVDRSCPDEPATTNGASTTVPAPPESTTTEPTTSPTPTTPTKDSSAAGMEKTYLDHLGANSVDGFKQMCDASYTHWSCFYEGVDKSAGDLRVRLVTDGGWSPGDLDALATQAGTQWFNFIGCDYPDLSVIVVTVNGLDHNVFRSDTNADATC